MPYNEGFDMRERIRINRITFKELSEGYRFLFSDIDELLQKPNGRFADEIKLRIMEYKQAEAAKLEAERQRIQADEEKKARAKIEAEQRAVVAEKEVAVAVAQERLAEVLAPVEHIPAAGKMVSPIRRPSDREIIRALCIDFSVSESVVGGWLREMDLSVVAA